MNKELAKRMATAALLSVFVAFCCHAAGLHVAMAIVVALFTGLGYLWWIDE